MTTLSLNDYLAVETLPRVCLINANADCYPLVDYTLNQIQTKLVQATRYKFNADRYFNYNEIKQILNSGSLFSDLTYIEINYKTKPTIEHQQELANIIENLDSNTTLLITTDKLNKKDYSAAWVKNISLKGVLLSLNEDDTNSIIKFRLKTAGLNISRRALEILQQLNQANVSQLLQVISHLTLLYPSGHEISEEDIRQHSIDNSQYNIYQLSQAYLAADLFQALKILDNIYQKTEDAILILWLLGDDIKKLIRLKARLKQKQTFSQIAEELRIWGNVSGLWQSTEQRLNYTTLVNLLDELANLDMTIKGIVKGDIRLQLINLITQLCHKR